MDVTFQSVEAMILQQIGAQLMSGNADQAAVLGTWKGLIKDTYEVLLTYSSNYGITDMRKYPYEQSYIYSNTVSRTYIEYEGMKYYF